jgi:DNA-3-methyladenine glycosylase
MPPAAARRTPPREDTAVVPGPPLPRGFYARAVLDVARDALGKVVVRTSPQGVTAGRIVETEAYRGPEDLAAHSVGGRRTPRTEAMFGPAGHAYVFLIYGMHFQLNLVTGKTGEPHAVLIRALEPVVGAELMAARRGVPASSVELTNGPGKLCRALDVGRAEYGLDLCGGGRLYLIDGAPPRRVERSPRIGVDYAGAWAHEPWRFYDADSAYVSRPPRARRKPS